MGAWDEGQYAAAARVADLAKKMASPLLSERAVVSMMRTGAQMAVHELRMELIAKGKKSVSVSALHQRLEKLLESLDALTSAEGK